MAGSVNKVILIGNLGRDPEVRRMGSGDAVVNLRIATSESWRDRTSGERKERTEWHSVVIFNENLAKIAEQYLKKGSKVYIEGQLQTRKWTDQSGQERYSTEVVLQRFRGELTLLDRRGEGGGRGEGGFPGGLEREGGLGLGLQAGGDARGGVRGGARGGRRGGAGEGAELVAEAAGRGVRGEFGVQRAALGGGQFAGRFEEEELFELFRVHGRDSWISR